MTRLAARVATITGWTEGQVQTAALSSALAVVVTITGLGPALGRAPIRPVAVGQDAQSTAEVPAELAPAVSETPATAVAPGADVPLAPAPPAFAPEVAQPPVEQGPQQAAPAQPAPAPPAPPPAITAPSGGNGEVSIATSAWYTDDAGTPLTATVDPVPEGALPVAARATRASRLSVVRLTGDATATELRLSTTTAGQSMEDRSGVRLCPVLDPKWKPGPAQPLSQAPPVDEASCVEGVRGDTTWTFPLTTFTLRTGGPGFALLPVSDPQRPVFQVSYAGS